MNNLLRLKVPLFLLFFFTLFIRYKPDFKYIPHVITLVVIQGISLCSGLLDGQSFEFSMTIQYLVFFLLFIILAYRHHVEILGPIIFASILVSIVTIIGFVIFTSYPNLLEAFYGFTVSNDQFIMMAKRKFLGFEVYQVFYKSIPVVIIPFAYYVYKLLNSGSGKVKCLLLIALFLFALFCSGNRTMMGASVFVVLFLSYNKIKRSKVFAPLLFFSMLIAIYVFILAITDKDEVSSNIKMGHLMSYQDYFSEKPYLLLFGSGAGSYFPTRDYGMTTITEMTYFEILRMYGIVGFCYILYFFLLPLGHYKRKLRNVAGWKALSVGYIIYLIISGSNPLLISSTGFICILLLHSVIENPIYLKKNGEI